MNPDPQEPRLTASVPGDTEQENTHPQTEEIQELQKFLTERPTTTSPNPQHKNIHRSHKALSPSSLRSLPERIQAWIIPASGAAVLALATFILLRTSGQPLPPATPTAAVIPPQSPQTNTVSKPTSATPSFSSRGSISTSQFPLLELPLNPCKPGLPQVLNTIYREGKLPSRNSVQLEEILNSFNYRLAGVTAIARSTSVNSSDGVSPHLATLATELIACPWKPSSTLLLVSLRGGPHPPDSGLLKLSYQPNTNYVFRYRLLGYNRSSSNPVATCSARFVTNSVVTLAVEIESSKQATDLGSLVWSSDGRPAPEVRLNYETATEPSDDARFAALVCTYSQWLAGEQAGMIDANLLSAMARELASPTLSKERADFLLLIEKSLRM